MRNLSVLKLVICLALIGAVITGYTTRARWLPLLAPLTTTATEPSAELGDTAVPTNKIIVNEQAQQNLGLTAKPLKPTTYWKTISVPGMVVDRPGRSDRNLVAPTTGIVASVNHFPGDSVRPGVPIFTLKVLDNALHQTQSELFKATQDLTLTQVERDRLMMVKDTVRGTEIIAAENQIVRLTVSIKAFRQELLNRGVSENQLTEIAKGDFVTEMTIHVPHPPGALRLCSAAMGNPVDPVEVQELKVELGQHVQAGQTLCLLADHRQLIIEGRAFRDETALLEQSVQQGWPVEVDFQEDPAATWGELKQPFYIRHLSNTIDPVNRTFAFWMPLENQSRVVTDGGRTQTLWRFRPGQKVRLRVRVAKLDDVFVLPADAVTREGPEALIFTQNVNTFERRPVRILYQDRNEVVLANDGTLPPGIFVVQRGAAQLNRMLKAGGSGGVPKGYHVHADGSLHKNEDEGK